jgi:hypothetical protein
MKAIKSAIWWTSICASSPSGMAEMLDARIDAIRVRGIVV